MVGVFCNELHRTKDAPLMHREMLLSSFCIGRAIITILMTGN